MLIRLETPLEVLRVGLADLQGHGVPGLGGQEGRPALHNAAVLRGNGVKGAVRVFFHGLLRHADQGRGGGVPLPAAPAPAVAEIPVLADHHVAGFAGGDAAPEFSVQDDPRANACAQGYHHKVPGALSRAAEELPNGGAVRVVAQ